MQRQPQTPTTRGPAEWFTGDVYVDAIARSQGATPVTLGCVHFTPCAHTAWHRHSGGQTLYCTEGEGFVQARGGALIRLRPGDIVITTKRMARARRHHRPMHGPPRIHRRRHTVGRTPHRQRIPSRRVIGGRPSQPVT